jgi:DNA-binding HxlR family transcriptional regulator
MQSQSPEKLADTLNALAHKRRVLIFRTLQKDADTGRSFAHLAKSTGLCDSSLTHHLRVLERSGLVQRRKKGAISQYSLNTGEFRHEVQALLADCVNIPLTSAGQGPRLSVPA